MTYDPDTRDPAGAIPNRSPYDRARSGAGLGLMLGLLALLGLGALVFYNMGNRDTVASKDGRGTVTTTGSGPSIARDNGNGINRPATPPAAQEPSAPATKQ